MSKFISTEIKDLYIIEPNVFDDSRGYFFESYNKAEFEKNGLYYNFVQDNQSLSAYGTLRGLHFQKGKHAQAKLVYVTQGSVLDVSVDLRIDSPTYGQHVTIELSESNKRRVLIPKGFAHGFVVLSETAAFHYKCDNWWKKDAEAGIRFDDPDLNIDWKIDLSKVIMSEKDQILPYFKDISP